MENGFYWYLPAEDEGGELEGGPQVVQVVGGMVFGCGGALGVRLGEARGTWHGPLRCPWTVAPDVRHSAPSGAEVVRAGERK